MERVNTASQTDFLFSYFEAIINPIGEDKLLSNRGPIKRGSDRVENKNYNDREDETRLVTPHYETQNHRRNPVSRNFKSRRSLYSDFDPCRESTLNSFDSPLTYEDQVQCIPRILQIPPLEHPEILFVHPDFENPYPHNTHAAGDSAHPSHPSNTTPKASLPPRRSYPGSENYLRSTHPAWDDAHTTHGS